jgi:ferredoxin
MKRKIIEIDRELCDGCGLCTTACAEGALALDQEKKAVLVNAIYCDGLGACLDVCPTGALRVVERESPDYDAGAALEHVLKTRGEEPPKHGHGLEAKPAQRSRERARPMRIPRKGTPSGKTGPSRPAETGGAEAKPARVPSELRQWPIQLHLISPLAPYFKGSDLLVAADCTAFALGAFHPELLKGKTLVIACPKLDQTGGYVEKLAELIAHNALRSLTVAVMTVPCCSGLVRVVEKALERSGVNLPLRRRVVHIDGTLVA